MADAAGGGPQILEALLKTDSASSWNQDRLADFGKKTRKEARALVKGAGGEWHACMWWHWPVCVRRHWRVYMCVCVHACVPLKGCAKLGGTDPVQHKPAH